MPIATCSEKFGISLWEVLDSVSWLVRRIIIWDLWRSDRAILRGCFARGGGFVARKGEINLVHDSQELHSKPWIHICSATIIAYIDFGLVEICGGKYLSSALAHFLKMKYTNYLSRRFDRVSGLEPKFLRQNFWDIIPKKNANSRVWDRPGRRLLHYNRGLSLKCKLRISVRRNLTWVRLEKPKFIGDVFAILRRSGGGVEATARGGVWKCYASPSVKFE